MCFGITSGFPMLLRKRLGTTQDKTEIQRTNNHGHTHLSWSVFWGGLE